MNKRETWIAHYAEDIREKFGETPDMDLLTKVTIGLGPSIYKSDASKVSGSDPSELERVRTNFLIGKLGLPDGPELMEAITAEMDRYGRSERNKYRAVIYYMLARRFGKTSIYG
ncbi:DUF2853 family protein [Robiginitalea sp. M366]|uniref:DUF2853 family protein n=1 Tax=Robiginitalea aestuariiviva TaxID=3036903 RepID=UPI00240DA220|nr:DUF2853 family protein [Robiginitalea aestuariiviva]MDG1573078.1 DUF2853 family protein [Robiginitalea aestuariiviva]